MSVNSLMLVSPNLCHILFSEVDDLFMEEFGASPEETFAREFKAWFNTAKEKDCNNVCLIFSHVHATL